MPKNAQRNLEHRKRQTDRLFYRQPINISPQKFETIVQRFKIGTFNRLFRKANAVCQTALN